MANPPAGYRAPQDGRATAYVCRQGACELPTTDPEAFARLVAEGGFTEPVPPAVLAEATAS